MIDVDRRRHVIRTRIFLALMFGITLSGFWEEATTFALIVNAVVWGLWWAAKGDELRTLKLEPFKKHERKTPEDDHRRERIKSVTRHMYEGYEHDEATSN